MDALLSIKPNYAEAILSGAKTWEFRKKCFREPPRRVYIYCSTPTKKVVGSFDVGKIIFGSPYKIWRRCNGDGGISKKEFFNYSNGGSIVYAIKISRVKRFRVPIKLSSFGKNKPPISFYYLNTHNIKKKNFFCQFRELFSKLGFLGGGNG